MVGSVTHSANHELSRVYCLATKVTTTGYLVVSNAEKRYVASGTGTGKCAANKKLDFLMRNVLKI